MPTHNTSRTWKRDFRCRFQGVSVHITCHPCKGHSSTINLTGYLFASDNSNVRFGGKKIMKNKPLSGVDEYVKQLISRLESEYQHTFTASDACLVESNNAIYSTLYSNLTAEEKRSLCPSTWVAQRTIEGGLAYFTHTMLPLLDALGTDITASDRQEITDKIVAQASTHGRGSQNRVLALSTADRHIYDFNRLYSNFRLLSKSSNHFLPEIELPRLILSRAPETEQIKSLPPAVLQSFCNLLAENIDNPLTAGAVMMLAGMLRTGEACAVRWKDINYSSDNQFANYTVTKQVVRNRLTNILKTRQSARLVILPSFAVSLLEKIFYNLVQSVAESQPVGQMFIVSGRMGDDGIINPDLLSAYIKDLLIKAGLSEQSWSGLEQVMRDEPDYDADGTAESDPSAYILRRTGCTLYINMAGVDPDLIDLMMGHKLYTGQDKVWKSYLGCVDNQAIVAAKMERVIFHPEHSKNPACSPIVIDGTENMYSSPVSYVSHKIKSTQKIKVRVTVRCEEPAEPLVLRTSAKRISNICTRSTVKYDFDPPIGSFGSQQNDSQKKEGNDEAS